MRPSELIKTPSFIVLVVFIAASTLASLVPSPWRDEALLTLTPKVPAGLKEHTPLIAWPAHREQSADGYHIDLGAIRTGDSQASTATPKSSATPPPSKAEAKETAEAPKSDAHAVDQPAPSKPSPTLQEDRALLASLQKLYEQLPKKPQLLVIPCADPPPLSIAQSADDPEATTCRRYALDNFYASLRARALGEPGHTRWMQYGDSLVIGDTFTAELRRLLQKQFGDGGHGWLYIGRPLRPVGAENIRAYPTDAWYVRTIVRNADEGGDLFGLGGAEFRPTDESDLVVRPPRDGEFGKDLKNFYLYYFAPPDADTASFRLRVDDATAQEEIKTTPGSSGIHHFTVKSDAREIALSGFSSKLRYYGLVSESDGGVVVDNLGLVSGREEHLLKVNADQWHDQLAFRSPDLVAFFYGVNAASSNASRMRARAPSYIDNYKKVLARAMKDAPTRDCLVLSLLTRGERDGDKIVPTGAVEILNSAQKTAALHSGCAFFDTPGVMGGPDGTAGWTRQKPPLLGADLSHPTRAGHHVLARHLYTNLIAGFIDYLSRRIETAEVQP